MSTHSRDAVTCTPLHQLKGASALISSVAIDDSCQQVYIGFTDGQIEEHRLHASGSNNWLVLTARKHVSNKPLLALRILESVKQLAVLTNGQLILLSTESLEGEAFLGVKDATAFAVQPQPHYPLHLAIAMRHSRRDVRFMIFEVFDSSDSRSRSRPTAMCVGQRELPLKLAVKSLVWVEERIIFCTSLEYCILDPATGGVQSLFSLQEDAISKTIIAALPGAKTALLSMDQVGIAVDANGHPLMNALTFPSGPSALVTAGGSLLLAVCSDAVHVYDLETASLIQSLHFPWGQPLPPDQQLLACSNQAATRVLVAGFRKIWLYKPVGLEEQARQMLQAHSPLAALQLATRGAAAGETWTDQAFAEIGHALLLDGEVAAAMDALGRCSVSAFQPSALLQLFPDLTEPWHSVLSKDRDTFGPLPSLQQIFLAKAAPKGSQGPPLQQVASAERAIAEYLLKVRGRAGVKVVDGITTLLACLLVRLDMPIELERLVSSSAPIRVEVVERGLQERGDLHALAVLYTHNGREADALKTWQALAESAPGGSSTGHVQPSKQAAVAEFTKLLLSIETVDHALIKSSLLWLLAKSPMSALEVIKGREMDTQDSIELLEGYGTAVLWQYLDHLVYEKGSTNPSHHQRLAMLAIDNLAGMRPELDTSMPAWERSQCPASSSEEEEHVQATLQKHLRTSALYDSQAVLGALVKADLFEEQVIVHRKVGDLLSALQVLALVIGDVKRAQQMCREAGNLEAYLTLLKLLLHPPDNRPPLYVEACRLLASEGVNLNPMSIVETLSDEMPLAVAADILARILRERLHRHRQSQIIRNLHRSQNLTAAAGRAEVLSEGILVEENRACSLCHTRIGGKMFWALPNKSLICYKCARSGVISQDSTPTDPAEAAQPSVQRTRQ